MDQELRQLTRAEYPSSLREIPGSPDMLFVRGTLPQKGVSCLAVVGSRAMTPYGKQACETLIEGLKGYPVSIISGLALGVDACAHEAALNAGLHTVAVLASGVDDSAIGPKANAPLAERILASGGALISENAPTYTPFPSDFPKRNRIVAGLADAVLIIEAGEKSGTLITARLAVEYNRELLCVPHRMGDAHGAASDIFVRLGATPVTKPEHILEALRITPSPHLDLELAERERIVYDALLTPKAKADLIAALNLPSHEALETMLALELKGVIREEFGTWRRTS